MISRFQLKLMLLIGSLTLVRALPLEMSTPAAFAVRTDTTLPIESDNEPHTSDPTAAASPPYQEPPSMVKLTHDAEYIPGGLMTEMDDRTFRKTVNHRKLLSNIFQIPIQTLMAVNNLLQSILGVNNYSSDANNNSHNEIDHNALLNAFANNH